MSEVSSNSEEMGLVKIESEEVEPEIGTGKQKVTPILIPDQNGDVHGSNGVMTPAVALPSLRGRQLEDNTTRVFRGLWAMSDYAHTLSGQTSEWEYRLVDPSEGAEGYPVTGKYVGWFNLKHPAPRPGHVRIDERDIYLSFSNDGAGGYKVSGEGQNKFGKFTVHGTLSQDGDLQLYKAYKLKPKPVGNTPKFARTPSNGLTPSSDLTPREARVRKPSAVLSAALETTEVLTAPKSARRVSESTTVSAPVPVVPVQATTPKVALAAAPPVRDSGRAVRLPLTLQKCADLLKELQRHIHGAYFREPVDYVKLCIPDYPDIIKEPMDFHTIQCNLEKSLYFTHEAFAEHVRLVFKNAIAYNQRRDHPVNIAARELSTRFEERYRILLSQLNNEFETDIKAFTVGTERPVAKKSKSVGYRHSMGSSVRAATAGPREAIVPPALDAGMQALIEMQRTMKSMQEEILQLRTQLRQNDIKSSIEVQRQAAQVPMTFEEKQALVERINLLDEDRMKEVIEVVQEAFPAAANSDSDDVDIPIDDLDTLTLRRLQAIVSVRILLSIRVNC